MRYKLNETKEIRIPDEDIQRLMSTMKLDLVQKRKKKGE